ncbi:MAG: wax ester/triacylglycerol synthase family O-acyltransferase [Steroidobacteraceae bacterium]|nr:wax ester/triacylglycerol synthase family O-acyltransferase [Steroidobacteraceae bacterium]
MAASKPLNLLDLSFVLMDTRQTPMHVAGLQTFLPPPGAPRDFPKQVYEYLRSFPVTAPPFNYRLRGVRPGHLLPSFEEVEKVDLEYHLRHSALPFPGGERELGVLVSRLHSNPMDLDRPLWEMHLIEGLHGGRFAMYGKLHHSLADGVRGVELLNFSEDPRKSHTPPIWAQERKNKARRDHLPVGALGMLQSMLTNQARALPSLLRGLAGSATAALGVKSDPDFTSLAETPRTIFNDSITPQRRVATQSTSMARMKTIGEAAGGSINDVLLAACGQALRRYLLEFGELPERSLVASVPVAIQKDDSEAGGNAISFANVKLGTELEDVRERFEMIRRSSVAGRDYLKQMTTTALITYTVLISSPQMLTRLPGLASHVPPIYNVIISNVPGPRRKLYFLGAEMEAYYPISALAHGQALNITVMSYAGGLYFGFTACPDRVPRVQRIAVYMGEALDELEQVFVGKAGKRGAGRKRGKAAGKAVAAGSQTKAVARKKAARTSAPEKASGRKSRAAKSTKRKSSRRK